MATSVAKNAKELADRFLNLKTQKTSNLEDELNSWVDTCLSAMSKYIDSLSVEIFIRDEEFVKDGFQVVRTAKKDSFFLMTPLAERIGGELMISPKLIDKLADAFCSKGFTCEVNHTNGEESIKLSF